MKDVKEPIVKETAVKKEPETLQISVSDYNKLKEQVELLTKAADQRRMTRFSPKEEIGTKCKVTVYSNSIDDPKELVYSWRKIKDIVISTTDAIKVEDQITEITLSEDRKIQMPLRDFGNLEKKEVEIIGTSNDSKGEYFTFMFDGKKETIDVKYVN